MNQLPVSLSSEAGKALAGIKFDNVLAVIVSGYKLVKE
jgi:hypothetical protein